MEMYPRVLLQPNFNLCSLMGTEVIQDDMQIQVLWRVFVDLLEEINELLCTMPIGYLGLAITSPLSMLNAGYKLAVPFRL